MDVWAQIWPIPYKNGKVHKSVVTYITWEITIFSTFEEIYRKVVKSGITDDDDILATTRAIRANRDRLRKTVKCERKAIMA